MKYWRIYTKWINHNCAGSTSTRKDLAYWRNNLFAFTIIYLLPFCLIALLPGLYWSFFVKMYVLAIVDIFTLSGILVIAFIPGIKLLVRKIIFIFCLYILSITLIYYLGLSGPGLIYLLASSIFSMLIIPTQFKFWPAWTNTSICILFAVAISFHFLSWPFQKAHPLGEWIAVCSNLVFLSFLLAILLPFLLLEFTLLFGYLFHGVSFPPPHASMEQAAAFRAAMNARRPFSSRSNLTFR